ncbi:MULTISPECIES: hypothetical protein [unclassified Mycolicibacterium]|uniref:Uncharacterized protein n=1 Tax=Mycolicibacterium sp. CBMA 213 TaxID=1968788 RepID=A0A343VRJ1_9MYCO|nr:MULTISPECIES: hypothetical protein [unclassified Mycolicibacterium]AVN58515.1 hypothetical protein B5P44_p00220 [Mycolicibacterium sp. CBMA 213]
MVVVPGVLFGDDGPPDRDEVLRQGFLRDLARCKELLPDARMWPGELDATGGEDGAKQRVDRRALFGIAERVVACNDEWGPAQLHAAIAVWGAPPGIAMRRTVRPFDDPNAVKHFADALAVVRGEGPISAYRALSRGSRLWIRDLGPSYFTKFLYFGGFGAKRYMSQPLIMDDNVVKALGMVTGERWEASLQDYGRYLDLAADWASELDTEADVIEWRLFQLGS